MHATSLKDKKAYILAVVTIFTVAKHKNIRLIKKSEKSYLSPFREEFNASFSIYDNGKKFKDFARDEVKGDVFTFYQMYAGCDFLQAVNDLEEIAHLEYAEGATGAKVQTYNAQPVERKQSQPIELPPIEWNALNAETLANTRGLSIDALRIAYDRGLLGFSIYKGYPCWIFTDTSKRCAQARRVNGELLWGQKAITIPGSTASYPIGLSESTAYENIVLCEGGADALAAIDIALKHGDENRFAPVAMMGATHSIGAEFLPAFADKKILIVPDNDTAGKAALEKWGNALSEVANIVQYLDLSEYKRPDGRDVKDLSELANMSAESRSDYEGVYPFDKIFKKENHNAKL